MAAERQRVLVDADVVFALGGDVGAPLALHRVKGQQMGRGGRSALEFVEVHHRQAVARAGIVRLALGRAHGRTQGQTADAAHSVDTDFHDRSFQGESLTFQ